MKKGPIHTYERKTGSHGITAQMASESRLRTQQWLKNGCNGFHMSHPISNPMSFWTEQDVLWYIRLNNLPICSVYGDIITDDEESGQLTLSDVSEMGIFDLGRPVLHTTGCSRTGCMFCGYGCHLEKPGDGRFEKMKVTHPKQYEYIMKPVEDGGLGYKEIIDWINENGGLNIKY
jgi:3'-phosphoadenosine 5'-phosphosulfate sulfotransferase (PAPS reductase)/FAD synthetase